MTKTVALEMHAVYYYILIVSFLSKWTLPEQVSSVTRVFLSIRPWYKSFKRRLKQTKHHKFNRIDHYAI